MINNNCGLTYVPHFTNMENFSISESMYHRFFTIETRKIQSCMNSIPNWFIKSCS